MSPPSKLEMSVSPVVLWAVGATSVTVRSMSDAELRRLEVVRDVDRGGLPVGAAARLLERSERPPPDPSRSDISKLQKH
jgi:hypothetical protein